MTIHLNTRVDLDPVRTFDPEWLESRPWMDAERSLWGEIWRRQERCQGRRRVGRFLLSSCRAVVHCWRMLNQPQESIDKMICCSSLHGLINLLGRLATVVASFFFFLFCEQVLKHGELLCFTRCVLCMPSRARKNVGKL